MARVKEFDEDLVLDKAVALFWTKGYNGTSAQDLVDHLGISRSSLYSTYGDKRTLFLKALQSYREKNSAAFLKLVKDSDNAVEAIKKIFKALIEESLDHKIPGGCFMVNSAVELAPQDMEIADIVRGDAKEAEVALSMAIQKGKDSGQFSNPNSAQSLARFLFNNISGMRVAARSGAGRDVLDDIVKNLLYALK
ncbi:MAG TPA: TetR/AcrR family transcriptional regulator [Pedobacter sp.]|nr:TetR/AcrR family transcriptional regulator [Pedobacter sp.]